MGGASSKSRVLVLFSMLLPAAGVYAAPPDYDLTREAGDIQGTVTVCGAAEAGVLVYAPGTPFVAYTNGAGDFRLSYVQQGTYDLVLAKENKPLGSVTQVTVVKKQTTTIGTQDFCNDGDGDGYVVPADCDDTNPAINPGADEACGDGIDNDCDGTIDEDCAVCTDNDGDGFYAQSGCGTDLDCDDSNSSVNPVATEVCDGIDNDCDGVIDEDGLDQTSYYIDNDGDGYGDPTTAVLACDPPGGYVAFGGDCDDANAAVHPGADEICDGFDNDCNTAIDQADVPVEFLCDPAPNNAEMTCQGTQGCVWLCSSGFENCDGLAANGCEIDILTSTNHCGGCGQSCPVDQLCIAGLCTP